MVDGARPVPLRPLALTELLDGAVRLVWARRRVAFPVAAPFAVVLAAAQAALSWSRLDEGAAVHLDAAGLATGALMPVLVGVALTAVLAPTLAGAVLGSPAAPALMLRRLPVHVALAVLVTVGLAAAGVALVVPALLLWGLWAVAAPAQAIEGLRPLRALRRSQRLVRGSLGRVWCARALGWGVTRVLALLAVVPFEVLGTVAGGGSGLGSGVEEPLPFVALLAVGQLAAAVLTLPVAAAVDVLIYTDLRARREGLDLVLALPPVTA